MPKIKTNRAAAKRFRKTGTGKIKCNHAFAKHIATPKTTKTKRHLRQGAIVHKTNAKSIGRLILYK
ncbi:MAG: 50S ribosomal protein L35 [Deltaproteobacteria bacterium]|jgi:large subunit ribosomal protein L35|nr:50S ribosomal protein L35 [Deltaproteobacteria bacterium]MBQ6669277.1 50S ribosomal protein L35 [Deltaproteobacteria bacterium]MBR5997567.1 50S ribosomal protein L35 [Deltaproteobacteria bacterium]MCR5220759.1 50S ribosomal protein L35 [bacterium]